MFSVFFLRKDWLKLSLSILYILAALILVLLSEPLKFENIPQIIRTNVLIAAFALSVLLFLSIFTFYLFLKSHYVFPVDIIKVFPLSFLIYVLFWSLCYGIYFTVKLHYELVLTHIAEWDVAVIAACFGLSFFSVSGVSGFMKIKYPWEKYDDFAVVKFHKLHKDLKSLFSIQKDGANNKKTFGFINRSDQDEILDIVKECKKVSCTIFIREKSLSIKKRYEKLVEDLSRAEEQISDLEAYNYASFLRKDPSYGNLNRIMDKIVNLNY